jgi:hypothetical protein
MKDGARFQNMLDLCVYVIQDTEKSSVSMLWSYVQPYVMRYIRLSPTKRSARRLRGVMSVTKLLSEMR